MAFYLYVHTFVPLLNQIKQVKMKKVVLWTMLTTSIVVLTCCSAEDPYSEYGDYGYEGMPNGGFAGNGSSSAVSGELTTFDVSLDLTTAEPEEAAEEY